MGQEGPGTWSFLGGVCGPRCLRLRCRELQHVELHHGLLLREDHQHGALRENQVDLASQQRKKTSLSQEAIQPQAPGDSLWGRGEENSDDDEEEESDVVHHRRVGEDRESDSSGGDTAVDADLVSSVRTDTPTPLAASGGDTGDEEKEEPGEAAEEPSEEESSRDGASTVGTRDDGDTDHEKRPGLEKQATFVWQEEERGLRARLVRSWDVSVETALSFPPLRRNNCLPEFPTKHTGLGRREHQNEKAEGGLVLGEVKRDGGSEGEEAEDRREKEQEAKREIEQQRRRATEHLLVLTESLRGNLWGTAIPSPYYDVVSCHASGHVRKTFRDRPSPDEKAPGQQDPELNDGFHVSSRQQGESRNDSAVLGSDEEVLSEENDKTQLPPVTVEKEPTSDEASCKYSLALSDWGSGPSDWKENRLGPGSRRPSLLSPRQHDSNTTDHSSSPRPPSSSSSSSSVSTPGCEGTEASVISKPFVAEPDNQRGVSSTHSGHPHMPLSSDAPASLSSKDEEKAVASPSSRVDCDDLRPSPLCKRSIQEKSSFPDRRLMDQTGRGGKRGKREKVTLLSRDGFQVYVLPMAAGEWIRIDSSIWFKVLR